MKKKIAVLGATGSIGKSTLEILRKEKNLYEPVLFSANKNINELLSLKKEFPLALTALTDENFKNGSGIDYIGRDGLLKAISNCKADMAVNGITGAAGLLPSKAVLEAGMDLALANKETLVMAGHLILHLANEKKAKIIPVDSEHSAIFKLILAHGKENISEIILTASGGPFRNFTKEELANVTPKEALAHPTWNMGPKITIDSATLANKGLEVIEAAALFGFPQDKIKVVIHPQSIVHSMVRLKDGAVYTQMSEPDMKLPISEALSFPITGKSAYGSLDFNSRHLDFESCDTEKFPMLSLAYKALMHSPLLPIAYNASNEIARNSFLNGEIKFLDIPKITSYVLEKTLPCTNDINTMEEVLEEDKKARDFAMEFIYKN